MSAKTMDLEAFWLLSDRPFLAAPLRTLGLLPSLTKTGHPVRPLWGEFRTLSKIGLIVKS